MAASIAIGVGATTTIFSALDAFLYRPLPFREADRLVALWSTNRERESSRIAVSIPDWQDWSESRTLALALYRGEDFNMRDSEEAERVRGLVVSSGFFDVLGATPQIGRLLGTSDAGPDGGVVLSYGFWRSRFGGSRAVLGQTLILDGGARTVVGVLAPEFRFPSPSVDVFVPLDLSRPARRTDRRARVVGRLRPGHDLAAARAEMDGIAQRLEAAYPAENEGVGVEVVPLRDALFGPIFELGSAVGLTAAFFVLLIAAANVANVLAARALGRGREMSIRFTLGASRSRVGRQLLIETMVLAVPGGILGVLLSVAGVDALRVLLPGGVPMVDQIRLTGRGLLFALGVTGVAGLGVGISPALHGIHAGLAGMLRGGVGQGSGVGRHGVRVRSMLVAGEMALAFALLAAAVLLMRAYSRLAHVDLGFDPNDVLVARFALPDREYSDTADVIGFLHRLQDEVASIPGVIAVGAATSPPLEPGGSLLYSVTGDATVSNKRSALFRGATPGYFAATRIPLIRGRLFTGEDRADSRPVLIVTEAFARRHWPGEDPIGKEVRFASGARTIVGVVGDTRELGPGYEAPPMLYFSATQVPFREFALLIRTRARHDAIAPAVRRSVAALDPAIPLYGVTGLDEIVRERVGAGSLMARVLAFFGGVALLLAAIGIYGVVSFSVAQRKSEFAVRIAMGAQRSDILRVVGRWMAGSLLLGVIAGLALAAGLSRVLASAFFGVRAADLAGYGLSVLGLLVTAVAAAYLPARRALRIDPVAALRSD